MVLSMMTKATPRKTAVTAVRRRMVQDWSSERFLADIFPPHTVVLNMTHLLPKQNCLAPSELLSGEGLVSRETICVQRTEKTGGHPVHVLAPCNVSCILFS